MRPLTVRRDGMRPVQHDRCLSMESTKLARRRRRRGLLCGHRSLWGGRLYRRDLRRRGLRRQVFRDDDGIDLLTLDEFTAVESLEVKNGIKEQATVIDAADPVEAMRQLASEVCVQMVSLTDAEFETAFTPTVEPMPIPRTIDLEAAPSARGEL